MQFRKTLNIKNMKKVFLTLALAVLTVSAFAQSKTEKASGWEISAGIGTQAYVGEYCRISEQFKIKDWLTVPAVNLNITRWATPTFGFSVNANWAQYKGAYHQTETEATFRKADDPVYDGALFLAKGSYAQAYAAVDVNITNIFLGYTPDRFFDLTGKIGGGAIATASKVDNSVVKPEFIAGLKAQFSLSESLKLNVDATGSLINDKFNGIGGSKEKGDFPVDGAIGFTAGISYKF